MEEIKINDKVQLKSGSSAMMVSKIIDSQVICVWMDKNKKYEKMFSIDHLEIYYISDVANINIKNMTINNKDELYKASLTAFFKNEADNDKLILGLSIAGIGFFISLIKDVATISELGFVTSIIALIMFFATSFLIILIFYYNKKQLLNIISNKGEADEDPVLSMLDKVKYIPFLIAVTASAIFVLALIF
jgi:uncharacterized protein YodC (DUF2158 family)